MVKAFEYHKNGAPEKAPWNDVLELFPKLPAEKNAKKQSSLISFFKKEIGKVEVLADVKEMGQRMESRKRKRRA